MLGCRGPHDRDGELGAFQKCFRGGEGIKVSVRVIGDFDGYVASCRKDAGSGDGDIGGVCAIDFDACGTNTSPSP